MKYKSIVHHDGCRPNSQSKFEITVFVEVVARTFQGSGKLLCVRFLF
jgi:hypothetical protein